MYLPFKHNPNRKTVAITEAQARYIKEMVAYHGSKADFDQFSLAYIGSGVGAQEFGEGLYFTLDQEAAYGYGGIVYTVELPDPDGSNYIYYNEPIPEVTYDKIVSGIVEWNCQVYADEYEDESARQELEQEIRSIMPPTEGRYLMYNIHRFVDEKTMIPRILSNAGVVGFFYNNGKVNNVVIFNSRVVKIVNKENLG